MRRGSQARTTAYFLCAAVLAILLLGFGRLIHFEALRGVATTAYEPVGSVLAGAARGARGAVDLVTSIGQVESEDQALKKEVAKLRRELAQIHNAELTDRELRATLGLRQSLNVHGLSAEVIGRDPDPLSQTITINAGSARGVRTGMAVLGLDGLVGRVVRVTPNASHVQLISDPNSPVDVVLASSHFGGTLMVEQGRTVVQLPSAPANLHVPRDELLLTSAIGGNYPAGIPVARVTRYRYQAYSPAQVADAVPLDNLAGLEYVTIDLDFEPAQP
jgi:rod shape-determining protein MreC